MSKQYLYRVAILSKRTDHPLENIAYFCGETQLDLSAGKKYESTTNDKVVWNNIIVPDKNNKMDKFQHLPQFLKFRSQKPDMITNARNILWQNVNTREKRPDSQFARLFELSVPFFFKTDDAINLINNYCQQLVNEGMIIDAALHSHQKNTVASIFEQLKIANNPEIVPVHDIKQDYTAYLVCTLRDYKDGQFIQKNRAWNDREKLKEWRRNWLALLIDHANNCSYALKEEKDSWNHKIAIYNDDLVHLGLKSAPTMALPKKS